MMTEPLDQSSEKMASLRRASAFFQLGNQLRKKGRPEQALISYEKALDSAPNQPNILNNIGLAHLEAKRPITALKSFERAIDVGEPREEYWHNKGLAKSALGAPDEAQKCYEKAISINQSATCSLMNLGTLYKNKGEDEKALQVFQKIVEVGGEYVSEAEHMVATLSGVTPGKAPKDYIARLFDQYADSYEVHLLRGLKFRVPSYLAQALSKIENIEFDHVLDGGCGTGLCAHIIRPYCQKLTGVDLSAKMIETAENKHLYDNLECKDLEVFFETTDILFDLMIFSDVFIYLGELDRLFSNMTKKLSQNGKVFFSVESESHIKNKNKDFMLRDSGRFQHTEKYIDDLLEKNKLVTIEKKKAILRFESSKPLWGLVYLVEAQDEKH